MNYEDFLSQYQKAKSELGDFVVVTLAHFLGSAPQILGARMIVGPDGYYSGTVGGGKLEMRAIETAVGYLKSEDSIGPLSVNWNLQTDLGMSCGGAVSLLFEKQLKSAAWEIAIFGAGHVSQELVRVLLRLDCVVTVIDPRQEWLLKLPSHTKLKTLCCELPESMIAELSPRTFVVVSTMGHATDLPILRAALPRHFPFIGAIGSTVKSEKLKLNLLHLGVAKEDLTRLRCPIGEPIGNNTPPEIAISIAAQLLRMRDQKEN